MHRSQDMKDHLKESNCFILAILYNRLITWKAFSAPFWPAASQFTYCWETSKSGERKMVGCAPSFGRRKSPPDVTAAVASSRGTSPSPPSTLHPPSVTDFML